MVTWLDMTESVSWRNLLCEYKSWWLQRSVLSNPLFLFFFFFIAEGNRAECFHSFWGSGCWQHSPFFFTPLHLLFSRQLTDISGSGASGDDGGLRDKWKGGGRYSTNEGQPHIESYSCGDGLRGWRGGVLEWKGGKGATVLFDAGGERRRWRGREEARTV